MKALVVTLEGFGGALLAGPAVRAVATRATRITLLCSPRGAPAAQLLPHVDDVMVWPAPARDPASPTPDGTETEDVQDVLPRLREEAYDVALVLTPYDQSPLPVARRLRDARVRRIGAAATIDSPGGLLDVHPGRRPDRHEAEAALDAAAALGFTLRPGDDGRLRVLPAPDTAALTGNGPYVVVHPGAGAPAHAWQPGRCEEAVALLADAGHRVVVTGGPHEKDLTRRVSGDTAVDLGGRTTARTLAGVLRAADVLVAGGTGPAQLAAAVGTPVVSLSAPAAQAERRAPYGVPVVLVGHPCPDEVMTQDVVRAVQKLAQSCA